MSDAEHAAVLRRRLEKWWDRFDPAEKAALYRAFELLDPDAERRFLAASVAVWREIDRLSGEPTGYKGLAPNTHLRQVEREAWEQYRTFLDVGAERKPTP